MEEGKEHPLIDEMRTDEKMSVILAMLEDEHGSPLPKELQVFLVDQATSSESRIQNTVLWVERAYSLATKVVNGEAHADSFTGAVGRTESSRPARHCDPVWRLQRVHQQCALSLGEQVLAET